LTDLPQPFLDLREGLQGERVAAYGTFPGLEEAAADRNAGALSPRQLETIADRLLALQKYGLTDFKTRADLDRGVAARHETAKRVLIAQGRPRAAVEKLPPLQVALLHTFVQHDRLFDDIVKWQNFPYGQAPPKLQELEKRQREELKAADAPAIPVGDRLVSTLGRTLLVRAWVDRRIATLRCLEAIRLYAAAHGGKLPPTLDDIKEVPIPLDPVTGKPFRCRVTGARATLYGPPPDKDEVNAGMAVSYELTLTR
jgi:hypothetical protein